MENLHEGDSDLLVITANAAGKLFGIIREYLFSQVYFHPAGF